MLLLAIHWITVKIPHCFVAICQSLSKMSDDVWGQLEDNLRSSDWQKCLPSLSTGNRQCSPSLVFIASIEQTSPSASLGLDMSQGYQTKPYKGKQNRNRNRTTPKHKSRSDQFLPNWKWTEESLDCLQEFLLNNFSHNLMSKVCGAAQVEANMNGWSVIWTPEI